MSEYSPTALTTLRRRPARGSYDRAVVAAILDEAVLCHVSFCVGDQACCIPMAYARAGDAIYLHGSPANRALAALRAGARACVNVTLLDGLVLARSAFRTSVNYRSVVIYGRASELTDARQKRQALRTIVEAVVPGRWQDVRGPSEEELEATLVLRMPLVEVSAKVRSGPPQDKEEDYARQCWAGVIPLEQGTAAPVDDPRLLPGVPPPRYATGYVRPGGPSEEGGS